MSIVFVAANTGFNAYSTQYGYSGTSELVTFAQWIGSKRSAIKNPGDPVLEYLPFGETRVTKALSLQAVQTDATAIDALRSSKQAQKVTAIAATAARLASAAE